MYIPLEKIYFLRSSLNATASRTLQKPPLNSFSIAIYTCFFHYQSGRGRDSIVESLNDLSPYVSTAKEFHTYP